MHHHNWYYGQQHILARYCGLPDDFPPRIPGYLQHGWNVGCGWNPVHEFFDGAWRYVWSDAPRRRGHSLGRRNYAVVGAPMLYLMDLEPTLGLTPEPERKGTHGHDPNLPELHASFIAWGAGIKPGATVGDINNTDVAPTLAKLLGLEMTGVDGRVLTEALAD